MPVVSSWDGLLWISRPGTDDGLASTMFHELFMIPTLERFSTPETVFLDVGAHVGRYAVRMAKKVRWVHAVEPDPASMQGLRTNAALNEVSNMTTYQVAASDSEGPTTLTFAGRTFEARLARLDAVIPERPTLVLMDVEGAEEQAIAGLEGLIGSGPSTMIVELHHLIYPRRVNVQAITEHLVRLGYSGKEFAAQGASRYLIAVRQS